MRINEDKYFDPYHQLVGFQIETLCESFEFAEKATDVGYQIQASAIYSSNIEGNSIDLNSYMNSDCFAKNGFIKITSIIFRFTHPFDICSYSSVSGWEWTSSPFA